LRSGFFSTIPYLFESSYVFFGYGS